MNTNLLKTKLNNKEYRDAFTAEYIYSRIPLKIRAMRERRHMSQEQLAEKTGGKQEWISKLEDPNYGRLTLSTLLKLASAFDVGLNVDFVPFSEILERSTQLSPENFDTPSYDEENQSVATQAVAEGIESYAELLSPGQPVAVAGESSALAAAKQTVVRPHAEKDHNRGSVIFINRDRELLIGRQQQAASAERAGVLAAAAG